MQEDQGMDKRMQGSMDTFDSEFESNLRKMILNSPVAMCILMGSEHVVEIANDRMFELWGKPKQQMLGKPIFEGLPEAMEQGFEELLKHVYTTGETFSANERPVNLPRNGAIEIAYINFVYDPFRNTKGEIIGVMAVAIDVTDQVKARIIIEEKNQELSFVTDIMPQMMWATEADGLVSFFNRKWMEYTGIPYEELTGDGWIKTLHPDDLEKTLSAWNHSVNTGDLYEVEYRVRRYDGIYRWFLVRGTPMKDQQGNIVKWYGSNTDIQDNKQFQDDLEQRVKERTYELEMRNKELEEFTYVSSHDLQEPLRKILIFSEMIQSDKKSTLSNESGTRLNKLRTSALRMSAALSDLLNFASLDKGDQFIQTDLNEILDSVKSDLEILLNRENVSLHSDKLPVVAAIPHQMHQLFYNLVNNALKFAKPGESSHISILHREVTKEELTDLKDLDPGKNYYELSFKDNGIGFNPELSDKIFRMFQRLHAKETYPGTGIGLALCKKVVMNHQGKIWAESIPNNGSIFRVMLPLQ